MDERPRATVGGLIVKEGRVLLQLRNRKPFRGRWGLPGGHIERGESAEAAVKREVREETGLDFSPEFFCYSDEICPEEDWHALVIFFTGKASGRERPDPEEVRELRWFPLKEASRMELAFGHNKILERFLEVRHA